MSNESNRCTIRLVAYLRVSTIEQAEHGYGLAAQKAAIRSAAKQIGARIVAWCSDEGMSGTREATDRPGLTEALGLVRTGRADGLIVRDLDRLARKVSVQEPILAEVWRNTGASVYTASPTEEVHRDDPDDPMRTAMREMAGVFAGLERGLIVKRLRDGRKTKAANGGHINGPAPYGYRTAKKGPDNPHGALVPVPAEQKALQVMRSLAGQGLSTHEIAEILTTEGHPTKRGGKWCSATVARILKRDNTAKAAS